MKSIEFINGKLNEGFWEWLKQQPSEIIKTYFPPGPEPAWKSDKYKTADEKKNEFVNTFVERLKKAIQTGVVVATGNSNLQENSENEQTLTISEFTNQYMNHYLKDYRKINPAIVNSIKKAADELENTFKNKKDIDVNIVGKLYDLASQVEWLSSPKHRGDHSYGRHHYGKSDDVDSKLSFGNVEQPTNVQRPSQASGPAPAPAPNISTAPQPTKQSLNDYIQKAAKTINTVSDTSQKIALTKELINLIANSKNSPEWKQAASKALSVVKAGKLDPAFTATAMQKIASGKTIKESWKVYCFKTLLEEVHLSWKDVGLLLLKESTNKTYLLKNRTLL